jgi:hypothetical protein
LASTSVLLGSSSAISFILFESEFSAPAALITPGRERISYIAAALIAIRRAITWSRRASNRSLHC